MKKECSLTSKATFSYLKVTKMKIKNECTHASIKQATIFRVYKQGCISCGILVSGIRARGVSLEHMENMEMFSCFPT